MPDHQVVSPEEWLARPRTKSQGLIIRPQPCRFSRMQLRTLNHVKYVRIDADRFTVGERNIELPVAMQDEATIDVGGGKVRIELDGLIEICNRPIMATLLVPDEAAVAVDIGVSEAESDRPIQVDECLIKCPFALP